MVAKTTHVIPGKDGWIVKQSDNGKGVLFSTRKAATNEALRVSKAAKAGRVIVHSRNGMFRVAASHGLPKVPKSPYKSTLGRNTIRKAVGKVVFAHLMAE